VLEFLSESEVIQKYQEQLRSDGSGRIAVAFWGNNGHTRLFGKEIKQPLRVICNLDSGACDPSVIRDLRSREQVQVRNHPRLHAKVYLTSKAVIVGSSNVSTNGLAISSEEGPPGWVEANLLCLEPSIVEKASKWFEEIWKSRECTEIKEVDLKAADERWKRRSNESRLLGTRANTILSAVKYNSKAFESIPLFLLTYVDNLSDEEANEVNRQRGKHPGETLTGYGDYGIQDGSWIIDCSMKDPRRPKVYGLYYVPGREEGIRKRSGVDIAFKRNWLKGYGTALKFPRADRELLEKMLVGWKQRDDLIPFWKVWASLNKNRSS
jgi:hypothetical protein